MASKVSLEVIYEPILMSICINANFKPSRFGSVVAHSDLDREVSGSSLDHTKDFENCTYCSSACAGQNELE